jgi:hypothetical protein
MKIPFPTESDMLISTSHREGVINLLLLVVVFCSYQIYQFPTGLRFILSLTKHFTITALKRQTYHRWDKLGAGTVLMKIKSYGTTLFIY